LEIAWALGLKYSDGLTRLWPSLAMLIAIALSFALLGLALKSVSFGTAYAVWTGIGAAGTVTIGMLAFGEPASVWRVTCLSLIIAGMLGLKLTSDHRDRHHGCTKQFSCTSGRQPAGSPTHGSFARPTETRTFRT